MNQQIADAFPIQHANSLVIQWLVATISTAFSSPEQNIENVRDAVVRIGLIITVPIITTMEI
ncbi:MAG: hypothetical protein ABW201_02895 [Candidatus Thiodiazotropha sp.]